MAYVGNPIDTQNTFQSLQGKRFSGDGSTTAFTLDVAPGNVLDIEVFVGNVRQDPNSAYTLSGTTLTFTGAPPSGTNNIYVVHQAKSVGTIDVPTGGVQPSSLASNVISGQTLVTLDTANDHVLINDATDGALKKALIPSASTVADTFTINGSTPTLTIGDAGAEDTKIVFDGNALDFHIGLDDSADTLNIGKGSALGTTTAMSFDTNGIIKTPLQPMFQAYASSNQSISNYSDNDVTFGGEDFDVGSNFASSAFTAPVAGKYAFFVKLSIEGLGSWVKVKLIPTGKQYQTQETAAAYHLVGFSVIVDMAANDTAKVTVVADDNSYTIIGDSGSTYHQSTFSGYLIG